VIPLYGFLEGDVLGLLVLASEEDTATELAAKLVSAASVRVPAPEWPVVIFKGAALSPQAKVRSAGFTPLDRFDVVKGEGPRGSAPPKKGRP
jgi:hypothetical protein